MTFRGNSNFAAHIVLGKSDMGESRFPILELGMKPKPLKHRGSGGAKESIAVIAHNRNVIARNRKT